MITVQIIDKGEVVEEFATSRLDIVDLFALIRQEYGETVAKGPLEVFHIGGQISVLLPNIKDKTIEIKPAAGTGILTSLEREMCNE